MNWLVLILSLPTENATARMRAWRTLKAAGAAALRDGVYVLPFRDTFQAALEAIADDVRKSGGNAYTLQSFGPETADFPALFDRTEDFEAIVTEITKLRAGLSPEFALEALKHARKLRKSLAQLTAINFFPDERQQQADEALQELEVAANQALSPDEPHSESRAVPQLNLADYQGGLWATRRRPWVDRLASAWLIGRFIDPEARFMWLASPSDCPSGALGFDFDGATFTHVGDMVTFETLVASFGLKSAALHRVASLVHYLDVGGHPPVEAAGVELVLMGLRETHTDDDQLLAASNQIFDSLLTTFSKGE
jgi:hypothetical protein